MYKDYWILYSISLILIKNTWANVTFEIINREPGPIWVGIQGFDGHPHLENGGISMEQGTKAFIVAPDKWAGKFWPRTWCDPIARHCLTGHCGDTIYCQGASGSPPFTMIEIKLKWWRDLDYYGITLDNGFNLRAFIEPINGESNEDHLSCARVNCTEDVAIHCPTEFQLRHNLMTIGCMTACQKFKTDEYCCKGRHDRPETCRSSKWKYNQPAFFKKECPNAHSYIFDENKKTFTCKASYYRIQIGVH